MSKKLHNQASAKLPMLLLLMLSALLPAQLSARDFQYTYEGQTLTYTVLDEDAKTVTTKAGDYGGGAGKNVSGDLVIPSIVSDGSNTYSVTEIGYHAFGGCSSLTSVTIPNSVTKIGVDAFVGCSRLTSVTIPNSVTTIRESAFMNCRSLTSVTIPNSVTTIDRTTFSFCSSLTSVTIPNSVTKIGYGAFEHCSGLTSVTIGNSVTDINEFAFYRCSSLTSVTIPNSVTSIGAGVFCGCSSLTSVTIPNSVTSISSQAFSGCSSLISVTIPNSVTSIGRYAFSECSGLTSVFIPNSVAEIGGYAFQDCSSLTSVTIPSSVTIIDYRAFSECRSLTSVTIPNSVTIIDPYAFYKCTHLASINAGSALKTIGEHAFESCAITEIVLPPHVKTIGNYAFAYNAVKNIAIGSEVTKIGENAFYHFDNQFDGVSITATTPPETGNNTFSSYDCPLYLMPSANNEVKNAYANSASWSDFTCHDLIPADRVEIEGNDVIFLHPGEMVALSAVVVPADASLPYIFWRSTNPSFATVDNEGIVTLVDNGSKGRLSDESCDIIAETLYANVFASIKVKDANTEIEDIAIDGPAPTNDIFTLQGICVKRNASQADIDALNSGLYIVGGRKVLVN